MTETEQLLLAPMDPPASLKLVLPIASGAFAESVSTDVQVLLLITVLAKLKPAGNMSVSEVIASAVLFGLSN